MIQTWRWFGPDDPIGIDRLGQAGVEGVVTALHHLPPGVAWTEDVIRRRQREVAAGPRPDGAPLRWVVAESLPVSEAIKRKGPERAEHVAAYRASLRALAACGVEVVCYNFMPVLDWTRTALRAPLPHGGTAMAFDLAAFAMLDIHLVGRAGAAEDYGPEIAERAARLHRDASDADKAALVECCVKGLPGAMEAWGLAEVRAQVALYDRLDADGLRANLVDFLSDVVPVAQEAGLRLCAHPDDPPFPLLGLPRVLSTQADYARLMRDVDVSASGITLCTGSMGVDPAFDGPGFVRALGDRIHFAHLRATRRTGPSGGGRHGFHEAAHLEGDVDMVGTVRALMAEQARRRAAGRADAAIPMRPDHGQDLLDDLGRGGLPGYPLVGRMRGLAELRGIMAACA